MANQEICSWTATKMAQRIRDKEVSCLEVMQAHLQQIEQINPTVNAIITLLPDRAIEGARAADDAIARGDDLAPARRLWDREEARCAEAEAEVRRFYRPERCS